MAQRIGAASRLHFGRDFLETVALDRQKAVKAVGQPVFGTVVKYRDRRENRPADHFVGVTGNGIIVGADTRLRATGDVNEVE